jgi:hypothetical protein
MVAYKPGNRLPFGYRALGILAAALFAFVRLGWSSPNYELEQVGLTGPIYSYPYNNGGTYQSNEPVLLNSSGQMFGLSWRYNSAGTAEGVDAWYFNGTTTQQIGLIGTAYGYSNSGEINEGSGLSQTNSNGQAAGLSQRYNSTGTSEGLDSWFFNRYSPTGTAEGQDPWFFNGTSTQQLGLTGTAYSYGSNGGTFELSTILPIGNPGQILGYSNRYSSTGSSEGQDCWYFNGTSTQQIGLTGPAYSYTSGGGTYQVTYASQINNSGQIDGYSSRTGASVSEGEDSWFFDGTTTRQIGLIGTGYSYAYKGGTYQYSSPDEMNSAGEIVGSSNRYTSTGTFDGADSWYFNGATTQQIGLIGAGYDYGTGMPDEFSAVSLFNIDGQAAGFSNRYSATGTAEGQDAWFFDPATDETYPLQFSVDPADGYSYSSPELLTNTGVVLGVYELFNGTNDQGRRVFYWSEANGFSDLGSLVDGGLSAQGWQEFSNLDNSIGSAPDGSPLYIDGSGFVAGQTEGGVTFLLAQSVPEPATSALLLSITASLSLRRHRQIRSLSHRQSRRN